MEASNITPHVAHQSLYCWECRVLTPKGRTTARRHSSGLTVFTCDAPACVAKATGEAGQ